MKHALAAALLLALAGPVRAGGEPVRLPGPGLELAGRLYRPAGEGPFPALVLLHGCSGLWAKDGEPTASFRFWAEHFQARGYMALLVDSFGPRGEKEICTQERRAVSPATDRPRDALAALRWLAARPDVAAARIGLVGWSNGGTAVLHALRPDSPGQAPEGEPGFRAGVAFCPGCAPLAKAPYSPTAPVLIQAGGADDWTPSRFCEVLAGRAPAGRVEIDVYPGAHHSFDRAGQRVRERPDVRNPNRPGGRGATVGTHPEARARAIQRATDWLAAQLR